jgi:hypothetical protein
MSKTTKFITGFVVDLSPTEIAVVENYDQDGIVNRLPIPTRVAEELRMWDLVALKVNGVEMEGRRGDPPQSVQWEEETDVQLIAPPQRAPQGMESMLCSPSKRRELQMYFRGIRLVYDKDITVEPISFLPFAVMTVMATESYCLPHPLKECLYLFSLPAMSDPLDAAKKAKSKFFKEKNLLLIEDDKSIAEKLKKGSKR